MVLVMKLTTFAWNIHDGRRPIEVCYFVLKLKVDLKIDIRQGIRYMAKESQDYEISFTTPISRLCVCS